MNTVDAASSNINNCTLINADENPFGSLFERTIVSKFIGRKPKVNPLVGLGQKFLNFGGLGEQFQEQLQWHFNIDILQ
jgi:hypothetical protein